MSNVSVFVGHSFTEEDEQVVGKFLDLLRNLTEIFPGFTWDHARRAEPKQLTEKVLEKMRGKDAFIGICTRKERVLRGDTSRPLIGTWQLVRDREFEWKTSDWIVQEIGLAVGRGMKLILLIENGVRRPGGLEGNIEYVPFDRSHPQSAFLPVIQMVQALHPTPQPVTSPIDGTSSPPGDVSTDAEQRSEWVEKWKCPESDWTHKEYRFAVFIATLDGDAEAARRIDESCRKSVPELDLAGWVAYCESVRIRYGTGGELKTIEKLAEANPSNVNVLQSWGDALSAYEEHRAAATAYEKAAEASGDSRRSIDLLKRAALASKECVDDAAVVRLTDRIRDYYSAELALEISSALREIHGDDSGVLGLGERILEIEPGNTDLRFNLAYRYSERESQDVALYHYLRIPERERSGPAWNNLGVALSSFQLRARAVESYRAAKSKDETLAMSNLAFALIGAGFIEEARRECEQALKLGDYDKNIDLALARIKEIPEEEQSKVDAILKEVNPKVEFMRNFGGAIVQHLHLTLDGMWTHPECDLEVKVSGKQIAACGRYKRPLNSLGLAAGIFRQAKGGEEIELRIAGRIYGRAMECTVSRLAVGSSIGTSILTGEPDNILLMYLSDSGSELQVLEKPYQRNPKIYALTKKSASS